MSTVDWQVVWQQLLCGIVQIPSPAASHSGVWGSRLFSERLSLDEMPWDARTVRQERLSSEGLWGGSGPLFRGAFNRAHMLWDAKEPTSPLSSRTLSFPSLTHSFMDSSTSLRPSPSCDLFMHVHEHSTCSGFNLSFFYGLSIIHCPFLSSLLCGVLPLFLLQTLAPSPSRSLSPQAVHM